MSTTTRRAVTVATGLTTLASGVGAGLVGLAVPASAATAPTLNQTTCAVPNVATYNAAVVAAYKKSKGFVKLHAATVAARKKLAAARTPAAKALWRKTVAKSLAKENAALAAFTRLNTYAVFTGSATPAPVAIDTPEHPGSWSWGTYTTRVLTKGGKVVKACSSVDESAAGNGTVAATEQDKATSRDLYQGIDKPMTLDIPGTLPVLWYAAAAAPSTSAASVMAHVQKCVADEYTVVSAVCPKGGLAQSVGGLTGATYTVNGFEQSLQKALTSAKAAKKLG